MQTEYTGKASVWNMVPLFIVVFMITVEIIQPEYGAGHTQDSSIVNQIGLGGAYLIALVLVLVNFLQLKHIFIKAWPHWLLILFMLSSSLWSFFPQKVIISFLHQVGMALSVICAVVYAKTNPDRFIKLVVLYILAYMVATIAFIARYPVLGQMETGSWVASKMARWKGFTGHANSLGQVVILGLWCSLYCFLCKGVGFFWRIVSLFAIGLSIFVLYKTDSITSLVVSLFIVGIFIFYFLGVRLTLNTVPKYGLLFILMMMFFMLLYILKAELFSLDYLLNKVGRNTTLTGRTELWELGYKGFEQKPFFGWGFDSLRSFLEQFDLKYGQLHNGYLDLLVRGGLVGVVLYAMILMQMLYIYIRKQVHGFNIFVVWIAVWGLATLVYSFSEGVLVRNPNIMWLFFLFAYYFLIFPKSEDRQKTPPTPAASGRGISHPHNLNVVSGGELNSKKSKIILHENKQP